MSAYRSTRGRRSTSRTGRSSPANRDELINRDEAHLSDHELNSEEEVIGLSNINNATEEEASPTEEKDRRVRRRGPNQGTTVPDSPGRRETIVLETREGFDSISATREVMCIVKGFTHGRYTSYGDVPDDLHENMIRAFAEKFKWPDHTDSEVDMVFRNVATRRLRDTFWTLREKVKRKTHSNNHFHWKNNKPTWIDHEEWLRRLEEWSTEDWQQLSQTNSSNRASTTKGLPPKNTGGSVSYAVHHKRMAKEFKRPPTPVELFERTHRKGKSGEFIDNRSKSTYEKYNNEIEKQWPNPSERPGFHPDTWIQSSNGINKTRVYGLGSSQFADDVRNSARSSRLRSQGAEIEALKKQLRDSEERRQKEMEAAEERRKKELEDLKVSMEATMDSTMEEKIRKFLQEPGYANSKFPSSSGSS